MRGLFYSVDASDLAIDDEAQALRHHGAHVVNRSTGFLRAPEGLLKSVTLEISLFFGDQVKGHLGEAGLRSRAFG